MQPQWLLITIKSIDFMSISVKLIYVHILSYLISMNVLWACIELQSLF